jgi:hypothetical protein
MIDREFVAILCKRYLLAIEDLIRCDTKDLPEIVIRINEIKSVLRDMKVTPELLAVVLGDIRFLDEIVRTLGGSNAR